MRSLRATAFPLLFACGLFRSGGPARVTRVDVWHNLFGHQDHGLASQFAVLPVFAGIKQRAEFTHLILKSQKLIGDALWRAVDDQALADRFQGDLIVRLVTPRLEQLDTAVLLQFGE